MNSYTNRVVPYHDAYYIDERCVLVTVIGGAPLVAVIRHHSFCECKDSPDKQGRLRDPS